MPERSPLALSLHIRYLLLKRAIQTTCGHIAIGHWLSGAVHCMSLTAEDSSNPFLPERITYEREVLGTDFVQAEAVWSMRVDQPDAPLTNTTNIMARVETLVPQLRARLAKGASASDQDLLLYEDGALSRRGSVCHQSQAISTFSTLPAGVSEPLRAPPHAAVASASCQMPPCSTPGSSSRCALSNVS